DNRGGELVAILIVLLSSSVVFMALRCYVRIWIIKSFAADDWLALGTLVSFAISSGFAMWGAHEGMMRHIWALTPVMLMHAWKAWYFFTVFYVVSIFLVRLAVCFLLLRVCIRRWHKIFIYFVMGLNVLFNIYYFFVTVFQCMPVNYLWRQFDPVSPLKGHCVPPTVNGDSVIASTAVSVFTDWSLGLLPIFILRDLQMNIRKKAAIGILLSLASVVATLVRVPFIVNLGKNDDFFWSSLGPAVWSSVEPGLGIIVLSLATLRPLFQSIFESASS
ncbi:hypothetical protein NA57DRAFT_17324, partial [Rhizodiscina lignyota]